MNKLKNTKKSAAFDRSSLIINLFREFPNNKFSLKHLASASGGATKEGRLRTREIITELLAQGTIEECGQEKYRLSGKERPRQEGIVHTHHSVCASTPFFMNHTAFAVYFLRV